MLTVTQIARRIPWLIMGLILVGGLLHLFGPAELERGELIVIGGIDRRVNLFSSLAPPTRRMNLMTAPAECSFLDRLPEQRVTDFPPF